jgi:GNAT superfamily N-acetyltransferase
MQKLRLSVRENRLRDLSRVTATDYERYVAEPGTSWVAELDGRIVGFGMADGGSRSIWALFVDPDYEGRGAGQALLQRLTEWLFLRNAEPVSLSTAPGTRAEKFYLAQGWKRVGVLANGEIWLALESINRS